MQAKLLEVRDRATFIPVVAIPIRVSAHYNSREKFLINHVGYSSGRNYVLLVQLIGYACAKSRSEWERMGSPRTMATAHEYIERHFDSLNNCDVIDVEFILGETTEKCKSSFDELIDEAIEDIDSNEKPTKYFNNNIFFEALLKSKKIKDSIAAQEHEADLAEENDENEK